MSMLNIKNEKLIEAIKKLRELYPDDSLGDAIIMAVARIKKAEKKCEELNRTALEACERAHNFDKRYCDILVEKRQLEKENKAIKKALYAAYGIDEEFTYVDINKLEEMEK